MSTEKMNLAGKLLVTAAQRCPSAFDEYGNTTKLTITCSRGIYYLRQRFKCLDPNSGTILKEV